MSPQTLYIEGTANDSFVVAGWAKGDSAPLTDGREFAIWAIFHYTDGETETFAARFNPDTDSKQSWQYASKAAVAKKDYSAITVRLVYDYNVNTVYFDGIQLYKEEFGNSYTYDANGNVISVTDLQKKTTTYEYDTSNNLSRILQNNKAKVTYTYDNYHNVKTATTETGTVYQFAYDTYGNNTSVSIGNGITATAAYSADGNRLVSTTDALGKVTAYGYNGDTNELEWVQYPEDTEATRTEYTYDGMYRIATAACNTDTGSNLTASYTYVGDRLTKIETGSTTYNFGYGDFYLRTGVSVGDRTLAEYTYTGDRNNYLQSLDYGNDGSVEYTYDTKGRVTSETYEDGDTVAYQYDNNGALAKVTDSATGITTTYYYDLTDRMMKYVESGVGYSHSVGYEYDTLNNLTQLVENINGTDHTTTYTYDEDNRVKTATAGNVTVEYAYDDFGRIETQTTKNGTTVVLTESYTYKAPTSTTTSAQIATYTTSAPDGYSVTYSYTYDDNGNIASISDGTNATSYVYDSANQLLRENNQAGGFTRTWTYDNAGNITCRTEYAYTTGSLENVEPIDTVTYAYGVSAWGDLLTVYDGQTITSDTIGNTLSDGTWTYTWEHGRELVSMTDGSTTWTYTYNADGLRTKRTDGTKTYTYVYNGSQLTQMAVGEDTLYFSYDANGAPTAVTYNGAIYYYVTNLQGDVIAVLDANRASVVEYAYDAWGNILTTTGTMADTLGQANPLRYRGYVYDNETGFYLTGTRYYDPEIGRFINADGYLAGVGGDVRGYNLFAYCFNNPVNMSDPTGNWPSWSQVFTAVAVAAVAVAAVAVVVATAGAAAPALAVAGGGIISAGAAATAASVASAALVTAGVAATAAIVTSAVENTSYRGPTRDQSVYVMRDKTTNEVQYVGRTNNPGRRQSEHAKDPKKANLQPLEVKFSGLTKVEARAMEQVLISAYSLDNLSNARREIARGNVAGFAGKIGNVISIFGGAVEDEFLNLMGR